MIIIHTSFTHDYTTLRDRVVEPLAANDTKNEQVKLFPGNVCQTCEGSYEASCCR